MNRPGFTETDEAVMAAKFTFMALIHLDPRSAIGERRGMNSSLPIYAAHVDEVTFTKVCDGIRRQDFHTSEVMRGWLIEFDPGAQWPEVDHHETEERYFVLSGQVIEGEVAYDAGTYVVFPAGSKHQPRSESGATILGINVVPATDPSSVA